MRLSDVTRRINRALRFVHASEKGLARGRLAPHVLPTLEVTSPDFVAGEELPRAATAYGIGAPPRLVVRNVPESARSVVVICECPDSAALGPTVTWMLYRVPARDPLVIDDDVIAAAHEGKNSRLSVGYDPPRPPRGHGVHHYHFQVFALDSELPGTPQDPAMPYEAYMPALGVEAGAGRRELIESMRGHVVAWGEIIGTSEQD